MYYTALEFQLDLYNTMIACCNVFVRYTRHPTSSMRELVNPTSSMRELVKGILQITLHALHIVLERQGTVPENTYVH